MKGEKEYRFCGDCCHFKHEDTDGFGWCYKYDVTGIEHHCGDDGCNHHISNDEKRHHMAMLRRCQRCLGNADNKDMDVKAICDAIDFIVDYAKMY